MKPRVKKSKVYSSGFLGKHGHQSVMQIQAGDGFMDDAKRLAKRSSHLLVRHGKIIGKDVLRSLGPHVLSFLASKGAEHASKAGVPDFIVNEASKLVQHGAQKLAEPKGEKLSKNQRLVSNFVNNQSQDILNQILKRSGNGVGGGARLLGTGARLLGNGSDAFIKEAPRL